MDVRAGLWQVVAAYWTLLDVRHRQHICRIENSCEIPLLAGARGWWVVAHVLRAGVEAFKQVMSWRLCFELSTVRRRGGCLKHVNLR